jgi:hypothetical protein
MCTLALLPYCIYACVPTIVPLLEKTLKILIQYGHETCILLYFFYKHKRVTFEPNLESVKDSQKVHEQDMQSTVLEFD